MSGTPDVSPYRLSRTVGATLGVSGGERDPCRFEGFRVGRDGGRPRDLDEEDKGRATPKNTATVPTGPVGGVWTSSTRSGRVVGEVRQRDGRDLGVTSGSRVPGPLVEGFRARHGRTQVCVVHGSPTP